MQMENSQFQQFIRYGINPKQLNKNYLQQKIIQMYQLLQAKTTENMILRKQNDEIQIQIKTIKSLFSDSNLDETIYNQQDLQSQEDQHITQQSNFNQKYLNYPQDINYQQDINYPQGYDQHELNFNRERNSELNFNRERNSGLNFNRERNSLSQQKIYNKNYSQLFNQNRQQNQLQSSVNNKNINHEFQDHSFEMKILNSSKKPNFNSRFKVQQKNDNIDNIKITNDSSWINTESQNHQKSNMLNQKIDYLMKQNSVILKRMNQMQINFINGNIQNKNKIHLKHDDRSTNISGELTSIHNIWNIKQAKNQQTKRQAFHNRKHYSTNNLQSYCTKF